jgi:hypothetical protein
MTILLPLGQWKHVLGGDERLKGVKSIELVECACAHNLLSDPAFAWWAKHVLQKIEHLISKIKTRY